MGLLVAGAVKRLLGCAAFSVLPFGRTLIAKNNGNGRDHNQHHHVMVTIGKNVKSGVVGGLVTAGRDFGASDINSVTGLPEEGGDIPHGESMESAGKTLGIALGLDDATLEKRITGGKVVEVILNR